MPAPISRRPSGILDLLLAQQQGQNPNNLVDDVQPVLDLEKFYEPDRLSVASTTTALTAVGSTSTILVPAGERWKIYSIGVAGSFATVNQQLQVYVTLSGISGAALHYAHKFDTFAPVGATDIFAGGFWLPDPLLLPSGVSIKFTAASISLDAQPSISIQPRVLYVELQS